MSTLSQNNWRTIQFAVILLLSVALIVGKATVAGYACDAFLTTVYYPFFKIHIAATSLIDVDEENRQLREQLVEASMRVSMLEAAGLENVRLRNALGFEPPPGYARVPARAVSILGDRLPKGAVISRGQADSVFVDQPAINQQGLVGRIVSVMPGHSTVQFLTDPANRVAARVVRSREMGIVKYQTFGGLILDNCPVDGDIREGDEIVSSGLGGVYPNGLKVGTVVRVERNEDEPFCDVWLEPAAKFNTIEEIFLLKPGAP